MEEIDDIKIKRGREIFVSLSRNNGNEVALLPFITKYQEEDNREYTFKDILKYLQYYLKSPIITKDEVIRYNSLRRVSKATYLARGKEICDILIENNFKVESIEHLARKYADEDKRYLPYSQFIMYNMRNFYLGQAPEEYRIRYATVHELSMRSTTRGLDFDIYEKIINMEDANEAIAYMQKHNINIEKLKALRNAFRSVYEKSDINHDRVEELQKILFDESQHKFVEKAKSIHSERYKDRLLERTKTILSEYLSTDKDNLDVCIESHGMKIDTFNKYLTQNELFDEETMNLYHAYLEKEEKLEDSRQKLAKTLEDYFVNGVYYGLENRAFCLYDLLNLTDSSPKQIKKILRTYLPMGLATHIIEYINKILITSKFSTRDAMIEELRRLLPSLENKERDYILDYMEYRGWPYSIKLFREILERFLDGLITLPDNIPENKSEMNK